jgi:hypothetical protein
MTPFIELSTAPDPSPSRWHSEGQSSTLNLDAPSDSLARAVEPSHTCSAAAAGAKFGEWHKEGNQRWAAHKVSVAVGFRQSRVFVGSTPLISIDVILSFCTTQQVPSTPLFFFFLLNIPSRIIFVHPRRGVLPGPTCAQRLGFADRCWSRTGRHAGRCIPRPGQ